MSPLRPYPLNDENNSRLASITNNINSQNIVAGKGIRILKDSGNGINIQSINSPITDTMVFRGLFDFNESYMVDDVVYVDPNFKYKDQNDVLLNFITGSSHNPPIAAGLYRCNYFIPLSSNDSTYFLSKVVPSYANAKSIPNDEIANSYRWYGNNVYYPVYPSIKSTFETIVSTSGYNIYSNVNYWTPLVGCIPMKSCDVTMFVAGYVSGSRFNNDYLPYS